MWRGFSRHCGASPRSPSSVWYQPTSCCEFCCWWDVPQPHGPQSMAYWYRAQDIPLPQRGGNLMMLFKFQCPNPQPGSFPETTPCSVSPSLFWIPYSFIDFPLRIIHSMFSTAAISVRGGCNFSSNLTLVCFPENCDHRIVGGEKLTEAVNLSSA